MPTDVITENGKAPETTARAAPDDVRSEGVLDELDEIVDAANSLKVLVGLESAEDDADRDAGAAIASP